MRYFLQQVNNGGTAAILGMNLQTVIFDTPERLLLHEFGHGEAAFGAFRTGKCGKMLLSFSVRHYLPSLTLSFSLPRG